MDTLEGKGDGESFTFESHALNKSWRILVISDFIIRREAGRLRNGNKVDECRVLQSLQTNKDIF